MTKHREDHGDYPICDACIDAQVKLTWDEAIEAAAKEVMLQREKHGIGLDAKYFAECIRKLSRAA